MSNNAQCQQTSDIYIFSSIAWYYGDNDFIIQTYESLISLHVQTHACDL